VTVSGRILGIGEYQVEVRTRGGGTLVGMLDYSRLSWGRNLDDMSSADATAHPIAGDEIGRRVDALAVVREWEHELVIFRNGEEVWLGPITPPPVYTVDQTTVSARDVFAWLEKRRLPVDRSDVDADLGEVFGQYLADVLAVENSMGMLTDGGASGVTGSREVLAASQTRAADALRELGRTGVDWTVIGRTLRYGGPEFSGVDLGTLIDDHLLSPVASPLPGSSRVVVVGTSSSGTPPVGVATDPSSPMGLVEVVVSEPSLLTDAACEQAAQTRLDLLGSGAVSLTARLDPSAPVDFTTLIPGARAHVQLLRLAIPIEMEMRLLSVAVTHEVGDQGEEEAVVVTFTPLGTEG
jgi:hypothetical protein